MYSLCVCVQACIICNFELCICKPSEANIDNNFHYKTRETNQGREEIIRELFVMRVYIKISEYRQYITNITKEKQTEERDKLLENYLPLENINKKTANLDKRRKKKLFDKYLLLKKINNSK